MTTFRHTHEYYLNDESGLIYKPCRSDGLDRNLTYLKRVDFYAGYGMAGLTLIYSKQNPKCGRGNEK